MVDGEREPAVEVRWSRGGIGVSCGVPGWIYRFPDGPAGPIAGRGDTRSLGRHHRIVRRFRISFAVEQQRMIRAVPRKVVQPSPPVVEIPEGHANDTLMVFEEQPEQLAVLFGLTVENVLGRAAGIEIGPG